LTNRQYCIAVHNLHKYYHKNIYALRGVSFNVPYGKVFGLLGPNEAGKITITKILTTLMPSSFGDVFVFGKDIRKRALLLGIHLVAAFYYRISESHAFLSVKLSFHLLDFLWIELQYFFSLLALS
jgi:ABC-type Na+ transport system ATPase subunit NatA